MPEVREDVVLAIMRAPYDLIRPYRRRQTEVEQRRQLIIWANQQGLMALPREIDEARRRWQWLRTFKLATRERVR